jgi:hypothetical protein
MRLKYGVFDVPVVVPVDDTVVGGVDDVLIALPIEGGGGGRGAGGVDGGDAIEEMGIFFSCDEASAFRFSIVGSVCVSLDNSFDGNVQTTTVVDRKEGDCVCGGGGDNGDT